MQTYFPEPYRALSKPTSLKNLICDKDGYKWASTHLKKKNGLLMQVE